MASQLVTPNSKRCSELWGLLPTFERRFAGSMLIVCRGWTADRSPSGGRKVAAEIDAMLEATRLEGYEISSASNIAFNSIT